MTATTTTTPLALATEPLHGLDPRAAAEHAHLEALLRVRLLESGVEPAAGPLRIDLPALGLALVTEVVHRSPSGWHRFGPVRLEGPGGPLGAAADPVTVVALLSTETASRAPGRRGAIAAGEIADLVERTAESVRRVTAFITDRRAKPEPPAEVDAFLESEQALLLGHLYHPSPKSRDGISEQENRVYSPELRGSFRLHWFAADPSVVSHDAVDGAPSLKGRNTVELLADLAGRPDTGGRILVPAHPWQARDVLHRPRTAALIASGALEPLGELGPAWWPTSSVRTLYRPGAEVMLKLSLGLRLTNSRRESTRTELLRGLEINRLLDAGHADATFAAHPGFSVTRDPAWLAVDEPGRPEGPEITGLDVAVREVPDGIESLRTLVGLVAPRPGIGRTPLGEIVAALGPGTAEEWAADFFDRTLIPMLHLYAATGIGLEAHQQNTLLRLDSRGRVTGSAFRDNQGYYLAASHLPAVLRRTGTDASTLAVVDDDVVDDRLSYYLLRNQALSVVGALAIDGLADERDLLGVLADRLRAALPELAAAGPRGDRLARRWLTATTLPTKGNLLTRLHGIDEVLAPLDAQSVYLDAPNPLMEASV
ncbi:IucA/IucC family protein [Streptomyces tsukubensis]|uniref:Siderophore synthetase n=2 Tax=Streptomyces TaxID=1883 RepID=A0A7G3UHE8_STRT9|nr:IucA/IucC family protein [Streptomyces tsukubensis]AZK95411.1 siderophore synthetase [Streptomyces tsukubensis]QKM68540.1 siderophore synthetase [Streptomyces tsukubensis NRRL18488]TAI43349.1 siderophore synthetase [Streptomyces tsukubensis]